MQEINTPVGLSRTETSLTEANTSGVSWAAVFAGALATAALYLILLSLGAGFGLSSVSPWSDAGLSSTAIGATAIVWLIVTEVLSSAMGGYLAGRLRTKWAGIHSDEVYFRDTAHGFLTWCTALVFTAAFLASAATSLFSHAGSAQPHAMAQSSAATPGPESYFADKLFRTTGSRSEIAPGSSHVEAAAIVTRALVQGDIASDDKAWLDQLVSTQTGLSATEADTRVTAVFAEAQQSADNTRKAIAHTLLWMFIALLLGAFTASFAATIGGRQRDGVVLI
jgi:hypothetical protein